MTNNLSRRLKEHNSGNNKSTKSEIPWKMVYHEIVKIELKLEKERNILNLALEENI